MYRSRKMGLETGQAEKLKNINILMMKGLFAEAIGEILLEIENKEEFSELKSELTNLENDVQKNMEAESVDKQIIANVVGQILDTIAKVFINEVNTDEINTELDEFFDIEKINSAIQIVGFKEFYGYKNLLNELKNEKDNEKYNEKLFQMTKHLYTIFQNYDREITALEEKKDLKNYKKLSTESKKIFEDKYIEIKSAKKTIDNILSVYTKEWLSLNPDKHIDFVSKDPNNTKPRFQRDINVAVNEFFKSLQ